MLLQPEQLNLLRPVNIPLKDGKGSGAEQYQEDETKLSMLLQLLI
jgi:hypothetical protein